MFEFIKKIFKKEEENHDEFSEDVPLDQLSDWFDNKSKELFGTLEDNLRAKFTRFSELLVELRSASDKLGLATIKEKDESVDPKIRNVVMGHRQNYIRLLKNTLLSLEVPEEPEVKHTLDFCETVVGMLEQVARNSAKSHYTVQHLFPDSVEVISRILKDLDELVKETKDEIRNKKIHDIKEIKKQIESLEEEYSRKIKLEVEFDKAKNDYEFAVKSKADAESRINDIKESDDFAILKKEQQTLQDVEHGITAAKRHIIDLIAPLEPALRKYSKIASEDEKMVENYATNPVRMLLEDKQLRIMDILSKMRAQIESGALEMKDKKQEKMIEKIDSVKREEISRIVGEYTVYLNRKNELLSKVSASSLLSERRKLNQQIESSQRGIEELKSDVDRLENTLSEIDMDKLVTSVENSIKEVLGRGVNIFISSS